MYSNHIIPLGKIFQRFPSSLETKPKHVTLTVISNTVIWSSPSSPASSSRPTVPVPTQTKPNLQFCEHTKSLPASWRLLLLEVTLWPFRCSRHLSHEDPKSTPVVYPQSPPLPVRPPRFYLASKMNCNFAFLAHESWSSTNVHTVFRHHAYINNKMRIILSCHNYSLSVSLSVKSPPHFIPPSTLSLPLSGRI